MLRILTKLFLLLAAVSFGTVQAKAARGIDVPLVSISAHHESGVIKVISTDGERWTEVEPSQLAIRTSVSITVPSGHVVGYKILEGGRTLKHKLFAPNKPLQTSVSQTFKGSTGEYSHGINQAILDLCNARLSTGRGIEQTHNLTHNASVALYAWTADESGNSRDAIAKYASVSIPVKCVGSPKPYSVDVVVTKQSGTCPQKTEVRAFIRYRAPATARFYFKVDGRRSDLHVIKARKLGGKPTPGTPPGSGTYLVERIKVYHLDPGQHTFRVEVLGGKQSQIKTLVTECPPFKVASSWLNYDVEDKLTCSKKVVEETTWKSTRPGNASFEIKTQGGLVVHSGKLQFSRDGLEYVARTRRVLQMGAFDSDMMAQIKAQPSANSGWTRLKVECLELKGDFSFIDNTGTKCPRKGKALINFSMNMETNVHYSLDCTNGHFSGVAQPVPDGKGGYVAPAYVEFDIDKTTQANCALKSVSPGKTKIHALKGHLFRCYKPTMEPVTTDFTADPKPTHNAPAPTIVVDPPRTPPSTPPSTGPNVIVDPARIVCLKGAVRNAKCYCPQRHKKVRFGKNKWRCDRVVVDPPRTPPGAGPNVIADPPRRISCRNGVVRNKSCFCRRTHKKVRVGPTAWNCVKQVRVVPPKKGGFSVNPRKPKLKVAPPARTLQKPKRKKKKSKKRRSSRNSGPAQMRMIRRR